MNLRYIYVLVPLSLDNNIFLILNLVQFFEYFRQFRKIVKGNEDLETTTEMSLLAEIDLQNILRSLQNIRSTILNRVKRCIC